MKLFQLIRKYLAAMEVVPLQPFQESHQVIALIRRFIIFCFLSASVILSLVFLGFEANTLNEFADSMYGCVSSFTITIIFAIFLWKITSLFKLIGDFEKRIEQRMENPELKRTYVKLNENIEKWSSLFYFFIVQVTVLANLIPQFFISFYLYFTTDLGSEAFSLPLPMWLPFDWKTPIGYLIAYTVQCPVMFFGCHICACYIAIFTASCYVIFTLCNDIKNEIRVFDDGSRAGGNPAELMKKVGDIVEFHSAVKQLVSDMDELFALTIIFFFFWSLSSICSTLLVVQMNLEQNANPLELIRPIFRAVWSFALLFLICEFGQMLTKHFDQLNDAINDCDWTSFPKEIQKILPIIIQNTDQEVVLETFKNASCSRESFKKVVNKGFSYFMVFREFR